MDILSYLLGKNSSGGGGGQGEIEKYINLEPTDAGNANSAWWSARMVLPEIQNLIITVKGSTLAAMFQNCRWSYIPKIYSDKEYSSINLTSTFNGCSNVKSLDLSGFNGSVYRLNNAFFGCTSLKHLDIRGFTYSSGINYTGAFTSVPTDCEIIVKSQTEKTWFSTTFPTLTNVKTASEYGG